MENKNQELLNKIQADIATILQNGINDMYSKVRLLFIDLAPVMDKLTEAKEENEAPKSE